MSNFEIPLTTGKLPQRITFDGDHILVSQDQSMLREGSHSMLKSGGDNSIWTLAGNQPVMKYWCHNTALDSNGNFLPRDEADSCSLVVFAENNTMLFFGAVTGARGTLPVFVQTCSINMLTGAILGTNLLGIINAMVMGASLP